MSRMRILIQGNHVFSVMQFILSCSIWVIQLHVAHGNQPHEILHRRNVASTKLAPWRKPGEEISRLAWKNSRPRPTEAGKEQQWHDETPSETSTHAFLDHLLTYYADTNNRRVPLETLLNATPKNQNQNHGLFVAPSTVKTSIKLLERLGAIKKHGQNIVEIEIMPRAVEQRNALDKILADIYHAEGAKQGARTLNKALREEEKGNETAKRRNARYTSTQHQLDRHFLPAGNLPDLNSKDARHYWHIRTKEILGLDTDFTFDFADKSFSRLRDFIIENPRYILRALTEIEEPYAHVAAVYVGEQAATESPEDIYSRKITRKRFTDILKQSTIDGETLVNDYPEFIAALFHKASPLPKTIDINITRAGDLSKDLKGDILNKYGEIAKYRREAEHRRWIDRLSNPDDSEPLFTNSTDSETQLLVTLAAVLSHKAKHPQQTKMARKTIRNAIARFKKNLDHDTLRISISESTQELIASSPVHLHSALFTTLNYAANEHTNDGENIQLLETIANLTQYIVIDFAFLNEDIRALLIRRDNNPFALAEGFSEIFGETGYGDLLRRSGLGDPENIAGSGQFGAKINTHISDQVKTMKHPLDRLFDRALKQVNDSPAENIAAESDTLRLIQADVDTLARGDVAADCTEMGASNNEALAALHPSTLYYWIYLNNHAVGYVGLTDVDSALIQSNDLRKILAIETIQIHPDHTNKFTEQTLQNIVKELDYAAVEAKYLSVGLSTNNLASGYNRPTVRRAITNLGWYEPTEDENDPIFATEHEIIDQRDNTTYRTLLIKALGLNSPQSLRERRFWTPGHITPDTRNELRKAYLSASTDTVFGQLFEYTILQDVIDYGPESYGVFDPTSEMGMAIAHVRQANELGISQNNDVAKQFDHLLDRLSSEFKDIVISGLQDQSVPESTRDLLAIYQEPGRNVPDNEATAVAESLRLIVLGGQQTAIHKLTAKELFDTLKHNDLVEDEPPTNDQDAVINSLQHQFYNVRRLMLFESLAHGFEKLLTTDHQTLYNLFEWFDIHSIGSSDDTDIINALRNEDRNNINKKEIYEILNFNARIERIETLLNAWPNHHTMLEDTLSNRRIALRDAIDQYVIGDIDHITLGNDTTTNNPVEYAIWQTLRNITIDSVHHLVTSATAQL